MIKWFRDIKESDFLLVGGKAYNLSKMINDNINVPNGFAITSDTYDDYVKENDLENKIKSILEKSFTNNTASKDIKSLFTIENLSEDIKKFILDNYNKIPSKRVAIRSSSTAEDLPSMSFAGQYNTYLNVTKEDILEKVILCWKSLWNERAIEYRQINKITNDFSQSVIIQEMINSKVSGVVFTANPINGKRNELVINSSFGLGEAIVSGKVNPDQYIMLKDESSIINKKISIKKVEYIYSKNGIELKNIDDNKKEKSSLNNAQLLKLLEDSLAIEDYFKSPQDIEFAFDENDELYILQSRNITTLIPIDTLKQDGKLRAYFCAGTILFGMKEPFTPAGFDIAAEMFPTIINTMTSRKKPLSTDFVSYVTNRIYVDMTYLLSSKFVSKQFGKSLAGNDLPFGDVMNDVMDKNGDKFAKQGIKFKIPFGVIKYSVPLIKSLLAIKKIPNEDRYDKLIELGDEVFNKQRELLLKVKTIEEKIKFAKQTLREGFKLSQSQSMYCIEVNDLVKIDKKLKKMYKDRFNAEVLIQSLPRCITQQLTIELNLLAKYYDENNITLSKDEPGFTKLLRKFGHRANIELDFGSPRWSEDPNYLLNLINSYMKDKMYERNLKDIEDKKQEVEQFINDVYQTICKDYNKKKAEKIKKQMINYRIAAGMRERPKFDIVRIASLGRTAIKSIGQSYVKSGYIDKAEDIFYIRLNDIYDTDNLRKMIKDNKEIYNTEMKRTSIPRVIFNNGEVIYSSNKIDINSKVVKGIALSSGIYEGIIRIVNNPIDNQLKEGEIMVTESTNPAWTPLFATAGALIMEYGGPMSHGGVVAREYGLPAVVGISAVTSILKDGDKVRVNGELGIVELLK